MVLTVPVLPPLGMAPPSTGNRGGLGWRTRAYFVAYTAGQVLPTSLGGDAVRIVETARRHGGRTAVATGTVVLERGLGGAATVLLGAVAFVLSIGRFDVSAYFWLGGSSSSARSCSRFSSSLAPRAGARAAWSRLRQRVRLDRVLRAFYGGVHHYRGRPRLLLGVFAATFAVQAVRVAGLAAAKAVGSSSRCSSTTSWAPCSSSCCSSRSR